MQPDTLEDLAKRLSDTIRALPIGPARTSSDADWLYLAWRVVRVAQGQERAQAGSSRAQARQIAARIAAGEHVPIDELRPVVLKPSEREFLSRQGHALMKAPSRPVTISVHEDADEETGEDSYTISDDGGEFDDVEESSAPDVQGDIDERRSYYREKGRHVVLDVPEGRGWR